MARSLRSSTLHFIYTSLALYIQKYFNDIIYKKEKSYLKYAQPNKCIVLSSFSHKYSLMLLTVP